MHARWSLAVFLLILALGCGIKAPPKPPLVDDTPEARPDAGCCGARP